MMLLCSSVWDLLQTSRRWDAIWHPIGARAYSSGDAARQMRCNTGLAILTPLPRSVGDPTARGYGGLGSAVNRTRWDDRKEGSRICPGPATESRVVGLYIDGSEAKLDRSGRQRVASRTVL